MKTIFWNVDTQYDFMRSDESFHGSLAIAGAREIEGNLEKITRLAAKKGMQVVNTADWHNQYSKEISDRPDFRTTFPPHCMQHTPGAEYVPATKPEDPYGIDWQQKGFDAEEVKRRRNIVLYKDAFDVFAGTPHAEAVLDTIKPDMAIVYGVATNVCVNFAVMGLLQRGVQVYVPLDAIKELPNLPLDAMLEAWQKAGARFIWTKEVEQYL
ncbi:isochorismatase family protein [Candidatus Woesearchaeota archaeon]|nr:isochorismatase family protein [Candidatus Woesearchaeota archaeon]